MGLTAPLRWEFFVYRIELPLLDPRLQQVKFRKVHRFIQSMCSFAVRTDRCQCRAQFLGTAQAFCHHGFTKPALLVLGMSANRFEVRRARDIVELNGTESGQFPVRCYGNDIEIAAVEGHALHVFVPFPALVVLVRLIGVEDFPGQPTAGGEFALVA